MRTSSATGNKGLNLAMRAAILATMTFAGFHAPFSHSQTTSGAAKSLARVSSPVQFDIVSVKMHNPDTQGSRMQLQPDGIRQAPVSPGRGRHEDRCGARPQPVDEGLSGRTVHPRRRTDSAPRMVRVARPSAVDIPCRFSAPTSRGSARAARLGSADVRLRRADGCRV